MFKEFSGAPGIYAEKHVTNQPFRLDGGNGIVIDLDVFLDSYFHHRLLVLLVHGKSYHPPDLNTQHIHRTAGSQAAHRGKSGEERIGVVAKQGNMAEFHRHIPDTEQPENEKDADRCFHGVLIHLLTSSRRTEGGQFLFVDVLQN